MSHDFMSRPFCSHVAISQDGASSGAYFVNKLTLPQNECNKVEIALRVVQFWSEIKLVITNFVITRLISDEIALHSVQLPLLIT